VLRSWLFLVLLAVICGSFCFVTTPCRAVGLAEATQAPHQWADDLTLEEAELVAEAMPAVALGAAALEVSAPDCRTDGPRARRHAPRKRRKSAVYKAAWNWLKDVVGSITHRRERTQRSLRHRQKPQAGEIVPTVRLDLRRERLDMGLKMKF